MKKLMFIILLLPLSLKAARLIDVNYQGTHSVVTEDENKVSLQSMGLDSTFKKEKCTKASLGYFKDHLQDLSKSSYPVKDKKALELTVFDTQKKVALHSPLGKYALNITQHLLTLKRELEISCKRK